MSREIQDQAALASGMIGFHMKHFHPDGKPDPAGCQICDFFEIGVPQPPMKYRFTILDLSGDKPVEWKER